MEISEIIQVILIKIIDKESMETEENKSQLMQFLWHICVPLYSIY